MTCSRCAAKYAGGRPEHFGSDPRCAFPQGTFQPDNWNCVLANALRSAARPDDDDTTVVWSNDQHAALLPWNGDFIVLGWYKSRGRTEYAGLLSEREIAPLTEAAAEAYLAAVAA